MTTAPFAYAFSLRKQENPALAAIPVCVMTAAGPSSPAPNTAAVVLRKPLDLDQLIAVITRLHEGGAAAPVRRGDCFDRH